MPKKSGLKFGDAIQVDWVDSFGSSGWERIDVVPEIIKLHQLGFFIRQDKNGIYLASGITQTAHDHVLGPSFIPAGCLLAIKRVKVGNVKKRS